MNKLTLFVVGVLVAIVVNLGARALGFSSTVRIAVSFAVVMAVIVLLNRRGRTRGTSDNPDAP